MLLRTVPASKIVLLGLADDLAAESRRILAEQGHAVFSYPFVPAPRAVGLIEQARADLVFCPAEPDHYKMLIEALKQRMAGLPLVVVSRQPDTSAWLEALQSGACDYCAPPFESISFGWILESALNSRRAAA